MLRTNAQARIRVETWKELEKLRTSSNVQKLAKTDDQGTEAHCGNLRMRILEGELCFLLSLPTILLSFSEWVAKVQLLSCSDFSRTITRLHFYLYKLNSNVSRKGRSSGENFKICHRPPSSKFIFTFSRKDFHLACFLVGNFAFCISILLRGVQGSRPRPKDFVVNKYSRLEFGIHSHDRILTTAKVL